MDKEIYQLVYIDGMDGHPYIVNLGNGGVKEITEHPAAGEGDKWFYDIEYDSGEVFRVFNVTQCVKRNKKLKEQL